MSSGKTSRIGASPLIDRAAYAHASSVAVPGVKAPAHGEIPSALNVLDCALGDLAGELHDLESALEPIVVPEPGGSPSIVPQPAVLSQVGAALANAGDRTRALVTRVRTLRNRLAL